MLEIHAKMLSIASRIDALSQTVTRPNGAQHQTASQSYEDRVQLVAPPTGKKKNPR